MFIVVARKKIPQPQRGEMYGEPRGLSRRHRLDHFAPLGLEILLLRAATINMASLRD